MSSCPGELVSQHAASPGLVADHETVCRAAYHPGHYNKAGVKAAAIRAADLLSGELSIWRLARDPAFDVQALILEIGHLGPPGSALKEIFATAVGDIRAARLINNGFSLTQRLFCVLDNCETDDKGSSHPEHAVVALENVPGIAWSIDDPSFIAAKELLFSVFKKKTVWP